MLSHKFSIRSFGGGVVTPFYSFPKGGCWNTPAIVLRDKTSTQSYRTSVYYVDLTLRDGVNLQHAIQMAKEIDQQSKLSGFNQHVLD